MPSWRKVILSGSDAALNSLNTTSITASVVSASQFTGSLFGIASLAVTALSTTNAENVRIQTSSADTNLRIVSTAGVGDGQGLFVDDSASVFTYNPSTNILNVPIISASQFTGSLFGTSSWAISASRAVSSSYALTASFALNGGGGLSGNQYETVYFEDTDTPVGATYVNTYPLHVEGWSFKVGRNSPTTTIPSGAHVLKDNRELFTNAKVAVQGEPFILLGFGQKNDVSLTSGDIFDHPGIDEYGGELIPGNVYGGSLKLRKTLYGIQDANGTTKLITDGGFAVKPSSPGFFIGQGGYYIFESASMQFNASGALISPVESASVRLGLATDSSSFTIAVGKNNLQDILYISRSGADARIAIGGNYRTPRNTLDISGSLRVFTSITASTVSASGIISSSNLSINGFPNVSASLASLSSGVGTLQQVTDAGNTTTNPISSSFAGVGFFGTASWAINVVNGGGGGGGGSDSAFLNQSTAATTWSFAHNLGTQYPVITVYDTTGLVIIPQEIDGEDTNNLKIYFPTSQSGYATAVGGTSALTYYSQSLTTASVNLNTITFTKGDSSTFNITVNTGSGGGASDFPYTGSAIISGSLIITGSTNSSGGFTGSLLGTSSWATNALTASFAPNYLLVSQTSSFVQNSQTSSFVQNSQTSSMLAPYVLTSVTSSMLAPYVLNSQTSSFVQNSQTSSFILNSQTSSFVQNSQTSSMLAPYVLTSVTSSMLAPYVLNSQTSSFVQNSQTSSMTVLSSSFSLTSSLANRNILTASVSLNTITFTKGDNTTFNITVDTGSGGGGGGGVTINNNVDNYIVTATGTANTLNGEVGLQYSGSILINASRSQFGGAATANTTHQFKGLSSDTYAGFLIQDPDGEDIFKTEGSIANSTLGISIGDFNNISTGTGITIDVPNDDILLRGKLVADNTKGITGSLFGTASLASRNILTASVSSNTITFTKGDGTTFPITVNTGSGGGGGTPGGANTTIQFNDSSTFSGSGNFTFNKTTNAVILTGSLNISSSGTALQIVGSTGSVLLSVSGSSPNIFSISNSGSARLATFTQTLNNHGILLVGSESYQPANGSSATDGVLIVLGVNRSGNRQLWIGDSTAAGSATNGFFRYQTGTPLPSLDAISGNGVNRLNVNIATSTTNAGVGYEYNGVTGTTLPPSRLSVNGGLTVASGSSFTASTAPVGGAIIQGNTLIGTATNSTFRLDVSGAVRLQTGLSTTGSTVLSGSISTVGTTSMTGSLIVSTNITASRTFLSGSVGTVSGSTLTVYGSGSAQPVFTVQGSSGELFSVTDSLTGSLFSVNDISGLPILEVFSDNSVLIGSYLDPMLVSTAKVTQTNSGSFVVYSLPTASYDTAFFEYSVRSGSNARVGTIMAIQSASSVNFMETTASQFGSTSAISFTVVITGSNMALTGSSTTGSWTIKTIVRGI